MELCIFKKAPDICVGVNLDVLEKRYTAAAQSFGFVQNFPLEIQAIELLWIPILCFSTIKELLDAKYSSEV